MPHLLKTLGTGKYVLNQGIEYTLTIEGVSNTMKLIKIIGHNTWEDWSCIFECPREKFNNHSMFEEYEIDDPDLDDEFIECDKEYKERRKDFIWIWLAYGICHGNGTLHLFEINL